MIVDSPAMLPVGDASAIANSVDGLVFLVDMHLVKRPQLAQAADQLRRLPCRLVGTVVRTDGHGSDRYGYYGSGYYYGGYGDDGAKTKAGTAAATGAWCPRRRRPPTRPRAAPPARRRCISGRHAARPPLLESRR